MPERLAIVGGDAAGMSAAATARRRDPELEVAAVERGSFTSYSACGIPYYVGDWIDDVDKLVARSPAKHRERGVDARIHHEVLAIDLDARTLTVRDADGGGESTEGFDQLVVATGARAVAPPIPGAEAIEPARTLDAALRFRTQVEEAGGGSAVVIGAGYIGLEMAEALAHRGLDVTLLDQAPQVFGSLDPDMAAYVQEAAENVGIRVLLDCTVEEILLDGDSTPRAVRTSEGDLPARHVVMATGVRPDVELARAAGLEIGETGAIATDDDQRCRGAEGVFAAGDCVECHHRLLDRPVNVQLGTHANKQGRIAGANATGGDYRFPGVLGTAISRICSREVARTGLTQREAADAGFDAVAETVQTDTRARYFPGRGPMWVKLVAERGSGRLLGAQIVGSETAGKRIDTLAVAIWNGMDVEALQWVDLSYAPPMSGVLDPVLVAARATAKLV